MLKRPINKLVLENDLSKIILMVILRLEFEQDPLHASVGSRWVHDLLRKKIKIICFYAQNDEWVIEKLTLKSTPMKLEIGKVNRKSRPT